MREAPIVDAQLEDPLGRAALYEKLLAAGRLDVVKVLDWWNYAWLRDLKEHWGVSLAALLYRARGLGVMGDASYRNAMMRLSQNGWRRAEPGRISALEMPSMLPRAREVLSEAGVDGDQFLQGSGLPIGLFEIAASRVPTSVAPVATGAS